MEGSGISTDSNLNLYLRYTASSENKHIQIQSVMNKKEVLSCSKIWRGLDHRDVISAGHIDTVLRGAIDIDKFIMLPELEPYC